VGSDSANGTGLAARFEKQCKALESDVVQVRRHIHRNPELGWHETKTQAFLADWLKQRGIDSTPIAGTGLRVDIGEGTNPVIYRADIDALPITDTKQPGRAVCTSQVEGVSHACGHDLHSAIGAGLAAVFHELGADLPGPVRFIFQPAEEVLPSGGREVVKQGGVAGGKAAFALHCDPTRDCGTVGVRTGPFTSTADAFDITIIGKAGHSARPHLANDAILASAEVVKALYTLLGQRVNPLEPAVINVGMISGGTAKNVISGRVEVEGVLRTLFTDTRERLHKEIRQRCEAAAAQHDCTVDVRWTFGAPPIVNHATLDGLVTKAARNVLGEPAVHRISLPSTGAEDFGEFSAALPSYMMRLGVRTPGHPTTHLHTSTFEADERAIGYGMRIMGRAVLDAITAEITNP
jgi:amidohydrolase